MMYLIKMAFRNILRNRRRSLLAASSVMISIGMLFFLQGFIGGFMGSLIKNSTKNETGHIRITTKGFMEKKRFMPVDENIISPEKLITLITNDPVIGKEIDLVAERFYFGLLLQYRGNNKSAIAMGGDPDTEKKLLMLNKSMVAGGYFGENPAGNAAGKKFHEIILGKKIADTMGLKVGDTTTVLVQGSDYGLHIPALKVAGIFQTGLNEMDDTVFQIPLRDAKEIMHCGDSAQQILIMIKDFHRADAVAALINKKVKADPDYRKLEIDPWTKAGGFAETYNNFNGLFNMIYIVISFLGAFIITNIMMMVVLERRKEIGIIKSMGFSRMEVMMLFLLEGTALGVVGSISGVILGVLSTLYFMIVGIDLSSSIGQMNMPLDNVIKITLSVPGVIGIMFLGIVVASFVAIIPSRKAAKMNAVDAIKSV